MKIKYAKECPVFFKSSLTQVKSRFYTACVGLLAHWYYWFRACFPDLRICGFWYSLQIFYSWLKFEMAYWDENHFINRMRTKNLERKFCKLTSSSFFFFSLYLFAFSFSLSLFLSFSNSLILFVNNCRPINFLSIFQILEHLFSCLVNWLLRWRPETARVCPLSDRLSIALILQCVS